jgi:hypothetical protein
MRSLPFAAPASPSSHYHVYLRICSSSTGAVRALVGADPRPKRPGPAWAALCGSAIVSGADMINPRRPTLPGWVFMSKLGDRLAEARDAATERWDVQH